MRNDRLRIRLLVCVGAFLAPISLGCGEPTPAAYRVLLVGDSITEGGVSAPTGPPFAELLAERLPEAEIVNVAVGSTTSAHWAPMAECPDLCDRADELLADRTAPHLPAHLVVVMLGSDDARGAAGREPSPTPAYNGNIIQTSLWLLKHGAARVMLVGPPPTPVSPAQNGRVAAYGRSLPPFCRVKAEVSCRLDLRDVLDLYDDFAPGDRHPNASGHAKIAAALSREIRFVMRPDGS